MQTKKINANLLKIVSHLNEGGYQDGTTMGAKLGMTRSAVWKVIKKLEQYEVKLHKVKGKGYQLVEPLILLDPIKIKKQFQSAHQIELQIFETIPSTNEYLKTTKNKHIKICIAEQQTAGRGRFDREWYSPFGKNIYLSIYYPFQKDVSELSGLSLVVSLAIVKTLREAGLDEHLVVKWPNDILYKQSKLAGCLIGIQAESNGSCQAIIGIGMNVNMTEAQSSITQAWTSVQKILNQYVDRNKLVANLIDNLFAYLQRFTQTGFAPFVQEWMTQDCLMQQNITLNNANQLYKGRAIGINEQGHLLLQLENGQTSVFSSGDTSISKKPL